MCAEQPLDQLRRTAFQRRETGVVERSRGRCAREWKQFRGDGADRDVFLGQQVGKVAIARVGEPRKQHRLLEAEMTGDVLIDELRQRSRDAGHFGRLVGARPWRARKSLPGPSQQIERGAVFVVERAADFLHRLPHRYYGIQVPKYLIRCGRSIDAGQAMAAARSRTRRWASTAAACRR